MMMRDSRATTGVVSIASSDGLCYMFFYVCFYASFIVDTNLAWSSIRAHDASGEQVTQRAIAPKTAFVGARVSRVTNGSKVEMSRWKGMDMDISDDQQDITRGRGMVDSKFQGAAGIGGTHVRQIERALIHNG